MADVNPLKLVDQGAGVGRLVEFETGDTLPKAALPALSAADVGAVAADDPRLSDAREWSAETVAQTEAEAGTATTRRAWTAQRVRQAIVAWWNGISSPFGRGLVAAVTATVARQELGLGNAATATVQSSNTDSTAGRVLTVGAAGILSGAENISSVGWNALGGMSRMVRAALNVATDGPFIGAFWMVGWYQSFDTTDTSGIFYGAIITNQTPRFFTRSRISGTWGAWVELYHKGNILGTVSQSGGIPTGAIIERGSNANGRFTKYACGTVIMDKSGSPITTNPVTTVGAVTSVDGDKLRYGFWY